MGEGEGGGQDLGHCGGRWWDRETQIVARFRNIGHNPNPRLGIWPTNGISRYQVIRRLIARCIAIPIRNRSYIGTLRFMLNITLSLKTSFMVPT